MKVPSSGTEFYIAAATAVCNSAGPVSLQGSLQGSLAKQAARHTQRTQAHQCSFETRTGVCQFKKNSAIWLLAWI